MGTNEITMYINGKVDRVFHFPAPASSPPFSTFLGMSANGGGGWRGRHKTNVYDGLMDEISVWSGALSPAQVWHYRYYHHWPRNQPQLRAYWSFDEGSGSSENVLHDDGPLGLHWRVHGNPLLVPSRAKPMSDLS